jgi:hypothetical protein
VTNKPVKWSVQDQRALDDLIERKEQFMTINQAPIEEIVVGLTPGHLTDLEKLPVKTHALRKYMTEMMINNADQIRDALAPFDSGVRHAPEVTEG